MGKERVKRWVLRLEQKEENEMAPVYSATSDSRLFQSPDGCGRQRTKRAPATMMNAGLRWYIMTPVYSDLRQLDRRSKEHLQSNICYVCFMKTDLAAVSDAN